MWLCFNQNGALVEPALQHGPAARAGTTNFQIFAYFDGVDLTSNNFATVKLIKPDFNDSSYPLLAMRRVVMKYEKIGNEHSEYFSPNGGPNGDGYYPGFLFDFSNFQGDQSVAILLDTPGLWRAVITLFNVNQVMSTQGTATFNVQYGNIVNDGTEISIDELMAAYSAAISSKLDAVDGIVTVCSIALADVTQYQAGQVVYDKSAKVLYQKVDNIWVKKVNFGYKPILSFSNTLPGYSLFEDWQIIYFQDNANDIQKLYRKEPSASEWQEIYNFLDRYTIYQTDALLKEKSKVVGEANPQGYLKKIIVTNIENVGGEEVPVSTTYKVSTSEAISDITVDGVSIVGTDGIAAIPDASSSVAGIITTGTQDIAGNKTLKGQNRYASGATLTMLHGSKLKSQDAIELLGDYDDDDPLKPSYAITEPARHDLDTFLFNTGITCALWNHDIDGFDISYKYSFPEKSGVFAMTSDISSSISALDGIVTGTPGSGKTLTAFSETDGIVSATFENIQISESQVSNLENDLSSLDGRLDSIEGLIPNQASSENPLADQSFVNSSIATNTAFFLGTYNIVTDLGLTTSATEQQIISAIATKLASESITPSNNDYVFVSYPDATVSAQYEKFDRYKYNGSTSDWEYEYTLNNSSFTAEQWAAINSGVTSSNFVTTNTDQTITGTKTISKVQFSNNANCFVQIDGPNNLIVRANTDLNIRANSLCPVTTTMNLGKSGTKFQDLYLSRQINRNSSGYGLTLPDTTSLAANSELLDSASAQTVTGVKTFINEIDLKYQDNSTVPWKIKAAGDYSFYIQRDNNVWFSLITTQGLGLDYTIYPMNINKDLGKSANHWREGFIDKITDTNGSYSSENTFNVINASDIVSNTLTQAQYDLITNGKPTRIVGTYRGWNDVILFPGKVRSNNSVSGCFNANVSAGVLGSYAISTSKELIINSQTFDLRNVGSFNGKPVPNFPTTNTGAFDFVCDSGTLKYIGKGQYDSPTVSSDTAELSYVLINTLELSADTTLTLATAPANSYPEYRAEITNTDSLNSIDITLTGVTKALTNNENILIVQGNNTKFSIPPNATIELNIQHGKAIICKW